MNLALLIANALTDAARDLLVSLLLLTAVSLLLTLLWCVACIVCQHRMERHPVAPLPDDWDDEDFERELAECLRVIGGSRGPERSDREAA